MKRAIEVIVWTWKNDRKEFWDGIFGLAGCVFLIWFTLWFLIPTFAYDI